MGTQSTWELNSCLHTGNMQHLVLISVLLALISAAPQGFTPVGQVVNSRTGEVIDIDAENLDINGCLVGPSGEKVCPLGAFGSDGQSRVLHRGNKGPGQTGSNGNAGPLNAAGQAVDPAAQLKIQQDIAYTAWAEQQIKNAEKQLGFAGK